MKKTVSVSSKSLDGCLVVIVFVFVASLIPTAAWYCCDDGWAELLGVPEVGQLSFWFVYATSFLVNLVTTKSVTVEKKK